MISTAYQHACQVIGHAIPSVVLIKALDAVDAGSKELHLPFKGSLIPTAVGHKLGAQDIDALCTALGGSSTTIESLTLANLPITDKNCIGIAKFIQSTSTLKYLDLTGTDFSGEGLAQLSTALAKNTSLLSLHLKACKFGGSQGVKSLINALKSNTTLQVLNVANTDLTVNDFVQFRTLLSQNDSSLRDINLDRAMLLAVGQEEVASHVADILRRNTSLQKISLKKYGFADYGASQIAAALESNTSLQAIDLSCNRIGRDGAQNFGKMLLKNTSLKDLDLDNNGIEDEGLLAICNSLLQCETHTLTFLGVASNKILGLAGHRTGHVYYSGVTYFAKALPTISSLTRFHLWGNPGLCAVGKLDSEALTAIAAILQPNHGYECDIQAYIVDGAAYVAYKDDSN